MGFSDQETTSYSILKGVLKSESQDIIPGIGRRIDLGSCEHWVSCGLYGLDPSLVPRGAEHFFLELGQWADGRGKPRCRGYDVSWVHDYPVKGGKRGTFSRGDKGRSTLPDQKGQSGQ